ncbi:sensor histidine kinase [Kibdelosporangium aridum]|uniref:histidine kinase n=1 Tax=Kibdelosporangium aridum TaxID=2030 RepID=A0A1W2EHR6_KIBAR|nr:HAMP domain-containing sensor histidine kinase [Kibdelosporangium aridum]SMD09165.1 Signal transduction histidine kinase [Kibdelosporangium aridum]
MRLTARTRLTLLFSALIAFSGAVLAVIVIVLAFTPNRANAEPKIPANKVVVMEKSQIDQLGVDIKAQARTELLDRLMLGAGIGIGVLTVGSAGLGWLLAGRVLRPVHVVSGTARRLSQQNLHERIPVSGPQDEMRELAETFNDMLARLQRSFDAQSHFAANAAHELRGPMTTQRTLVEVAACAPDAPPPLRELASSLGPVLDRQERLVNGLLELAWSEHGVTKVEPVRVDSLVRAPGASLSLQPLTVRGDPTLLDLMVDNLVRNAFTHGREVWVSTTSDSLCVENTGEVVPAERLATLTEPFRRGSQDRLNSNGTGLGLAIVNAVVRAHNASLELTPRPGGGIRATVRFPAGTMR